MVEYRSLYKLSVFVFVSLVVLLSISTVAAKEQFIADYTKQMEDEGTQGKNMNRLMETLFIKGFVDYFGKGR